MRMLIALILLLCGGVLLAQEKPQKDTLETAYTVAYREMDRGVGLTRLDAAAARRVVSVIGEGDVLKLVQMRPGISAGSEGSSAFYVRGGNLGHNAVTMDGVRIYGYSHLLGLTTAFPNTLVEDVSFALGGFGADSYNLMASHTQIRTKDGNFRELQGEGSVSNFMVGGFLSAPLIKDRLSIVASARISPLIVGIGGYRAGVYDLYSKLTWRTTDHSVLRGSVFYSKDNFSYGTVSGKESMGWGNLMGNLAWTYRFRESQSIDIQLYKNKYSNQQLREVNLSDVYNQVGMYSDVDELVFKANYQVAFGSGWSFMMGTRLTSMQFDPGTTKVLADSVSGAISPLQSKNLLANVYAELRYDRPDKMHWLLAIRGNYYQNLDVQDERNRYWMINPEISASGRYFFAPYLGIEGTVDFLTQYHHTLEGVPLGWSLDILIPADHRFKPEHAQQYYLGLLSNIGQHSLSLGAYYKTMQELVYFSEPTLFFGSGTVDWVGNIRTGKGASSGIEFLYQKVGKRLNYQLAYTYSRTTRYFEGLNYNRPFYAKYDRPHVLNVTADYLLKEEDNRKMGLTFVFTYQSGNLESVKSAHYDAVFPDGYKVDLPYYEGLNNFRLKDYMRMDLGYYAEIRKRNLTHKFNVGIYNVLNRHNIFSIYYDGQEHVWKSVSLFPILPSLSYQLVF